MTTKLELFTQNYIKIKRFVPFLLSVISLLEILMIINGVIYFDFAIPKYIVYTICYSVLLLASITTLVFVLVFWKKVEQNAHLLRLVSFIYETVMICWSLTLSLFECINGNYPLVYLTVIFAIPMILIINPTWNSLLSVGGTVAILVVYAVNGKGNQVNFYFNTSIATVIAVTVDYKAYFSSKNQFESSRNLLSMALRDSLTGLNNRRAFDDRLVIDLTKDDCKLVMIDVDNFKKINDTLGHKQGDECLIYISQVLVNHFSHEDVFRFGGDEYAIISFMEKNELNIELNNVIAELSQSRKFPKLTISAGIYPVQNDLSPRTAIQNADSALYEAKTKGKGMTVLYYR